ncbi:MAG: FAD-dependent oxidoreductase, partial [Clostridiales bacterium]|nr:FAD-dependent oxidoreductase [Clostridiales bacterium]
DFYPRTVIDCTGDIVVAKMAGCKTQLGIENSGTKINGATQVYRVKKKPYSSIDIVPKQYRPPYSDKPFEHRLDNVRVISSINTYPNGDLNINPLPTMGGDKFFAMSREQALGICRGRVYLHWRRMQQDSPDMRNYRIKEIYPMIGIRESYRLQGRYVLTEDDILSGLENQNRKEELIAFSDHPVDVHGGENPGIKILAKPYGIPYSCLLPQNITNLIVACRGSSFDSIAAASCRLSRTMIALGEAAGTAAAVCLDSKKQPHDADVSKIRDILEIPEFTKMLKREFGL